MLSSKVGNNTRGSGETEENCLTDRGLCFAVLSDCKTRAVWLYTQWFWITEVWHWHLSDLHRQWNWQGKFFTVCVCGCILAYLRYVIKCKVKLLSLFLSKIKELLLVGKWGKVCTGSDVMRLLLWKLAIATITL